MDTTYKNPNANFFPQPSSTTISNEALANPAPLTLPNAPQDTTNYAGITTSIPTFQDIQSQINQTSQAETTTDDLMQRILGTSAQVGQKAQRTLQAEQQAGLPQFQTQLQDVSSQIQALQKEALAIPLQIQEQATGRGVTAGGVAPIQNAQLRQNAIKSLTLSAIAQTLQGNIANARATADRVVQLEFAPLEAELNTLKTAYEMNKDRLARQDKKRADALNFLINERDRGIQQMKEERTFSRNIALQAIQSGAPQSVADRMANATPEEAMTIGAQYLGEEFRQKARQQAFENGLKTRQMALQEAEFDLSKRKNLLELAKLGDSRAIAQLGYDPKNVPLSTDKIVALEDRISTIDRDTNIISGLLTNNIGLEKSAGLLRGQGAIAGVVGAVTEGGLGIGTLPYNLSKRNDFLTDAKYIVNNLTFEKFRELADMGVKLTPVSNAEIKLIGESSGALASAAQYDEAGNLTGFKMSEDKLRAELRKIGTSMNKLKSQLSAELYLPKEDRDEIANTR